MRNQKHNNQLQEYILKIAQQYRQAKKLDKIKIGQIMDYIED